MKELTVLSFGGGQDSTAILLKVIHDPAFRARHVKGHLVVVISDTGNEHPHTYAHIERVQKLCLDQSVPFFHLKTEDGFHSPAWPNLLEPQAREPGSPYKTTMVQLGGKACTMNLKINPIYKFLNEYINKLMGYGCKPGLKRAFKRYAKDGGTVHVLLGFAFGEEKRATRSLKLQATEHESKTGFSRIIHRAFPLIAEGISRDGCIKINEAHLSYEVMPSNCMLCPYQSAAEILWLFRKYPASFAQWVEIERTKLVRHADKGEKNHGVYNSRRTLPELLEKAQAKHGHLTDAELHEHKKRHGCATNSM